MARIDDALNLVIPVKEEVGTTIYAYHSPISREVFEANYRLIAAAKAELSSKGVVYMMDAGPRIAALTLREESRRDAEQRGDEDIGAKSLLADIRRLTTILCPTAEGWKMLPVDSAIQQDFLDGEEWSEVESQIVFFTFHYAMSKKAQRKKNCEAVALVLKGSITSLSATGFIDSLPTSTKDAPIDSTVTVRVASSVPS